VTVQAEGSFRDALGSFVDATRKLAAATRTLDTVRALSKAHPCATYDSRPWTCRTIDAALAADRWCLPCQLAAAVNPSLTPKGPNR